MPGNSHPGPRTEARAEAGPRDEPPRRSRDAARSRSAILDAAERLFSDRGFRATTLGDIAAEAGPARGTPSYLLRGEGRLFAAGLARRHAAPERRPDDALRPLPGP